MKLLPLFLLTVSLSVTARPIAQTVTVSAKNLSLEKVFLLVKEQTGYRVFGNLDLLKKAKPVTLNAQNMPLADFLSLVLKDQSLSFRMGNETIFLSEKKEVKTFSEMDLGMLYQTPPPPMRGRVLDSLGKPLSGATVALKGSKMVVPTDQDGYFTMNLKEGDLIVISFVGYKTVVIPVSGKLLAGNTDAFTISLQPATEHLQDIIAVAYNTGYQSIARERSAGSVAKPDMKIYNDRVGSMNVVQRLDGLIPGFTVNNAPGADQFQIRGVATVGNTLNIGGYGVPAASKSPLFVVDGVPFDDISLINPNDVADVNVLKDATAASIWGTRAANGVIVITTKSGGATNRKLKIDYNTFVRYQARPDLNYLPVLSSSDFIQAAREIFDPTVVPWATINASTSPVVAPHELALYNLSRGLITKEAADAVLDSLSHISNLGQMGDIFYRNTWVSNHSLSISAGTEKYSLYGSFNYTSNRNTGNTPDNNSDIFKLNLRQDFTFNNRISAYVITDITNSNSSAKSWPSFTSRFTPYQLFKDGAGNSIDMSWYQLTANLRAQAESQGKIDLSYKPVDEAGYGSTKANGLTARITGGATVKLLKGLRFEGTYSYVKGKTESRLLEDQQLYAMRKEVLSFAVYTASTGAVNYYLPKQGSRLSLTTGSRQDWTVRNQLVYNNSWNGLKHQLTLLAGNEAQQQKTENSTQVIRGYNDNLLTLQPIDYKTLTSGYLVGVIYPTTGGYGVYYNDQFTAQVRDTRALSYYSNIAYTFLNKYSFNGSWRIDQSNLFGKDKSAQNKPVWSAGAVWNIKRENFLSGVSWINTLRIRSTYGITGNSPAPGVAASRDILIASTPSGYNPPNGVIYTLNSPANRRLTWELTKTFNAGVDFGLWQNRITGTLDGYLKNTDGILDNMTVNPFAVATGGATILGNAGVIKNKGIEFSITSVNIATKNFTWRTMLNGAYNYNKVVKTYGSNSITTGNSKVSATMLQGYAAYPIFAYNYAGLDSLGDPQVKLSDNKVSKQSNVTKPEDILFMGTYQPKWSGGLSNTFRYKAFDLQINIVYNLGHVQRRDVNQKYTGMNAYATNFHADFKNRWKKSGDEAFTEIPSFVASSVSASRRYFYYYTLGSSTVYNASFAKIRDLTLSYTLPSHFLNKYHINNCRIFGQVGNIMLWKANKFGIDPEFQSLNNLGGVRSMRTGQNVIALGANVSF